MEQINRNGITRESLSAVRAAITTTMVEDAYHKKLDRWSLVSRRSLLWFIEHNDMDDHLVDILNKLKGERNIQASLNSLAIKMKVRKELINEIYKIHKSVFAIEVAKLTLSGALIDALGKLGFFVLDVRDGTVKNRITGRVSRYTSNWYVFQEKQKQMFDPDTGLCEGLSLIPGELGGTSINTHSWERPVKFNAEQKDMLRNKASQAFRLIRKPREWWVKRFQTAEWYVRALKSDNESRASLKERLNELVDGIMKLSEYDRLYRTWSFQISGRFLAMCNVEGIGQHGSGKLAWELADPVKITRRTQRNARVDGTKMWAKTHKKGTITTPKAEALWKRNRQAILDWLIGEHKKMTDGVYLEGLHEILIKKIGDTTYRMIGRDLTTNGVAIFASNFRDKPMSKITNIGGIQPEVGDAHTTVAKMLGMSRQEAKDRGITAGLFHGQHIKNIAKAGSLSVREMIQGLNASFGDKWNTFNQIANYIGQNLITNMRTSTRMKSPEGWFFINQAYAEKTVLKINFFTLELYSHIREVDVIRDMPIIFNGNHQPMNNTYVDPDGNRSNNGNIKMSGGYANGVHMLDAWMDREVMRILGISIHDIHDNFFADGDKLDAISQVIRRCHVKMWKHNYLLGNVNYMIEQSGENVAPFESTVGDLDKESIKESIEFLQP